MTKTKTQQAQEYGNKIFLDNIDRLMDMPLDEVCNLFAKAYEDGYTACEQSLWHSVEEELPEKYKVVLVWIPSAKFSDAQYTGAYYDGEDWIIHYGTEVRLAKPTHWRELPSLPDTNTEKK